MENQQPSQSQYPQYIQCPRCGAYNYSNAQFCQNCHLPFYQPYQTPQPEQNRQFSSEQPVSERIPQDTFTAQKPKKKKQNIWKITTIVLAVLFILSLLQIGESDMTKKVSINDIPPKELSEYCMKVIVDNATGASAESAPSAIPIAAANIASETSVQTNPDKKYQIGDTVTVDKYTVQLISAETTTNYKGEPALEVVYRFTNNSDDSTNFTLAIGTTAFQNNIEAETTIRKDISADDYSLTEIRPGATIDVTKFYKLQDTATPVEIEIKKLISFGGEKYIFEIPLK